MPLRQAASLSVFPSWNYCRCFAHRMAARTTRAEIGGWERNNKLADASMIAKVQQIGRECQAEIVR
jgi:hypothetical protein